MDARREPRAVPPAPRHGSRSAAANLSLGRAGRSRKNLEALLELDLPGSTVIVGDGPARASLERRYPQAHFLGARHGEALADIYASADVFVFPSRTDTFGIVLIEAMASGLPVAAFPVPGPIDVVGPGAGVLGEDLRAACLEALTIPREAAREYSLRFTWKESARQFLENVEAARSASIPCRNGLGLSTTPIVSIAARRDWRASTSVPYGNSSRR